MEDWSSPIVAPYCTLSLLDDRRGFEEEFDAIEKMEGVYDFPEEEDMF
jgi:hypothetical protein